MNKLSIGINPLTWSNDDLPLLDANYSLEACLQEICQSGYAGVELGNKFPREPAVLKPILDKYNLQLISGWYSSRLLERSVKDEIAALSDHLHLLKLLEAKVIVYCDVSRCIHDDLSRPLSVRPQMTKAEWKTFLPRLEKVAAYLASEGMFMSYHHHMGTIIQSERDIDRLLEGTDKNVRLLLDTGHMIYSGGDPLQILDRWGVRINHVHCKDIRTIVAKDCQNRDTSFLQAVLNGAFTVPGNGKIDFESLITALEEQRYHGWLVVEADQDPTVACPLTYARNGYDHLIHCVNKARL